MLDFVECSIIEKRGGNCTIEPKFKTYNIKDLMIRGRAFYAFWDEENNKWCKDIGRLSQVIDRYLFEKADELKEKYNSVSVKTMNGYGSTGNNMLSLFMRYCKDMYDIYEDLDSKLMFKSDNPKREDYSTKQLPYDMSEGDISAYETLVNVLYSEDEKRKFEWGIGSVLAGDSVNIQKFFVFYGSAGTGKGTIMGIMQMIFDGYYIAFDSKSLVSGGDFSLEQFKSNPLVGIQHDGNLSRISENYKLNSLVSHERMLINEKFKSPYEQEIKTMLFMGSNNPVQITDAKSGMIRRLIDIRPTGRLIEHSKYNKLMEQIKFEVGAIAQHCYDIYKKLGPFYYDDYRAINMMDATNDFYNFIQDNFEWLCSEEEVTLSECWKRYKLYCEDANIPYPYKKMTFKNELKNYFKEFIDHTATASNVFSGFLKDKFKKIEYNNDVADNWLFLECTTSKLDDIYKDCQAQYATKSGVPGRKWADVETRLCDIDSSKEHFVRPPSNHVVIDFDYKDDSGNKDPDKNIEEASKYPKTYAEFSKSGGGIHLHYIYDGDVDNLAVRINNNVEVKKFTGNSALRRRLSYCNDIPIAHIKDGLPIKEGGNKVIDFEGFKNEKALRNHILKCIRKEHHGSTKPEVDFIFSSLQKAYDSGMSYDLTTLRPKVLNFAMRSSNQSEYCMKLVKEMKFASEDRNEQKDILEDNRDIVFYDVEVFPNLFLLNYKIKGENHKVVRMINPTSTQIEDLVKSYRLVGFNCRRYDNHILYGRMMGYSNEELYSQSKSIIDGSKNAFFGEAYNLSYTDVYDYAAKKQSLKKWEIELGIHHQELGLPWDEPVDESLWNKVAEYCDNDVIATEAVFDYTQGDFAARQILAAISGLTVNDSTNSHSKRIIFGNDRKPQSQFNYPDLSEEFPGYEFDNGVSTYRGEVIGEGGYVYAEPGMYVGYIPVKDVESQHPHSIIAMNLFGDKYTQRFADLLHARLHIKHGDFDKAAELFDGALKPFLQDKTMAKSLSQALKIVINSVYGLTAAKFDNPFRDIRNKDNVVAKRGALFMCELKHQVQERGFKVLHCKTDSIKILNPSEDILNFVDEFGKKYGYKFDIEDEFDKLCLVNDAVYVAHEKDGDWTATGKEFAHPFIFKTMFSKEEVNFNDLWETKQVSKGDMFLDMNEGLGEDEHNYVFVGKTGAFVPIKEGCGGGVLYRHIDDKYHSVNGTKGWRWLEAEVVDTNDKFDDINMDYYDKLVDEATKHLGEFGDMDKFINSEPVSDDFMNIPEDAGDKIPF